MKMLDEKDRAERAIAINLDQPRTQYGGLCYRVQRGKFQVLLITSRERQRWIVPKGWPMAGQSPAGAALTEAWEEAGVAGRVKGACIGLYHYNKLMPDDDLPCVVALYPVQVTGLADDYPEKGQRRRKWFTVRKAAAVLDNPELAGLIATFAGEIKDR